MVLATLLVTGACSHGAVRHPLPARPAPTVAPTTTALASTTTAPTRGISWDRCPDHDGWECGKLQVPLDHADPAGPTITVALSRYRTKSAHRVGALLLNPGGPGVSGINYAFTGAALLDRSLLDAFDIIGFDPRGVGASTPVRCLDGPALDRYLHLDPDPRTPAGVDALVAGAKEFAAGCEARNATLLPHLSTVDAAQDIDDIRVALGEPKLTYLGFSYGTFLGATYASLFPTHVRALALDAAVDPTIDQGTLSVGQAVAFEQNLDAFLADCATHPTRCPFHARAGQSLRQTFDDLAARVTAHPIALAGGRSLGPAEMAFGVAFPLYDHSTWPLLGNALRDAEAGQGQALVDNFDAYAERNADGTFTNSQEANSAVTCLDRPVPNSVEGFAALVARARPEAPFFAGVAVWGNLPCLYWPVPPRGHPGALTAPGAAPIVVVGSTGDPATPYSGAVHLAAGLGPEAVLITRHGEGHAGYPSSACVRDGVDSYLTTLAIPAHRDCGSDG